jgi:hypothetical protein
MNYWQGVASRANVFSIILLIVGAVLCFGAAKIAPKLFPNNEKMVFPLKLAGLGIAVIGALMTLL